MRRIEADTFSSCPRHLTRYDSTRSSGQHRRRFLQAGAATAAFAAVHSWPLARSAKAAYPATDRLRIAQIGLGGMGIRDANNHSAHGDHVAICDVDQGPIAKVMEKEEQISSQKPDTYADYRRILDRDDIDLISITTVDHWHVKIAIEALESGKHVFCQKPLTLTLEENQLIRSACRRHPNLVFQVGTQQRSTKDLFLRAVNMLQKGLLGKVNRVTIGIDGGRAGGPFKLSQPPKELDWDFWQGPAETRDFIKQRCHKLFRWWYEYSGGKFTDWGAHHVDIASWALDLLGPGQGPVEIDGTDVKHPVKFEKGYPIDDRSYNTAHDFLVRCRFADGLEMAITNRSDNGILFEGDKGRIFVNRGKITGKPIEEHWDKDAFGEDDLVRLYKGKPFENHKKNMFRCIREGGLPVSDVFSHVQAMNTCHLAAIAGRLGRVIKWDPKEERIVGDHQAASFFSRNERKQYQILRM